MKNIFIVKLLNNLKLKTVVVKNIYVVNL